MIASPSICEPLGHRVHAVVNTKVSRRPGTRGPFCGKGHAGGEALVPERHPIHDQRVPRQADDAFAQKAGAPMFETEQEALEQVRKHGRRQLICSVALDRRTPCREPAAGIDDVHFHPVSRVVSGIWLRTS
jgi:hypothetical protein